MAIVVFFVMWPPGPVFAVVDGGGERKLVASAGHRCARETGVVAMGVDVCEYESCEAEGGGPLLALRRREGKTQSLLSLRLRRPQPRIESAVPPLLEVGI
jgi:hypothetical protein